MCLIDAEQLGQEMGNMENNNNIDSNDNDNEQWSLQVDRTEENLDRESPAVVSSSTQNMLNSFQPRPSSGGVAAPEAEPRATDEGMFLSNLLHEIMPFISQATGGEPGNSSEHRMAQDSPTRAETSDVGSSRQRSDSEESEPNLPTSKRQKKE